MAHTLFLDIEASDDKKSIMIGAIKDGTPLRTSSFSEFEKFCEGAEFLIGHNIIDHDLKILEEKGISKPILKIPVIDTLLLSPLLRPDQQKHKLNKDYKESFPWINDPIMDSKQCEELLKDLVVAWNNLESEIKTIYFNLLRDDLRFQPFFRFVGYSEFLESQILKNFLGQICQNARIEELKLAYPAELAFVLAILLTEEKNLYTPSWLVLRFPTVSRVFDLLRTKSCEREDCTYCQSRLDPLKGLINYFSYDNFRRFEGDDEIPLQEQAVRSTLRDESILVIFPTGGGKSLTFQLPALMRGQAKGTLTVVISPLLSLMKDQVDVLLQKNVATAVAYNGLLNPLERADVVERIESGQAQLLYLAPESLRSRTILKLLAHRHIDRFVVDEAHCFSSWGQDFRVDYLYIARFIKKLQDKQQRLNPIPVSCFTATARPEVISDIKEYFKTNLDLDLKLHKTSQGRKNLEYETISVSDDQDRFDKLCELLEKNAVPTIIYVGRVKTTLKLKEKLTERGYKTGAYNGKMESEEKKTVQEGFKANILQIIVATSAFGMGVDKEDVGLVVHYEISPSLENYVQEAGRAGRNPILTAKCYVLYNEEDLNKHFVLLNSMRLTQKEISQIWRAIKLFREKDFSKSAREIARAAGWDTEIRELETRVTTAINALEQARYIDREENSPRIFANGILYKNAEEAIHTIEKQKGNLTAKDIENGIRIVKYILSHKDDLRVDKMAEILAINLHELVSLLNVFKDLKLLGDSQDMKARVDTVNSINNAKTIFQNFTRLEQKLFKRIWPEVTPHKGRYNLKEFNAQLQEEGEEFSNIENIRLVFLGWEMRKWIEKERLEAGTWNYAITFKKPGEFVKEIIDSGNEIAGRVLDLLYDAANSKATNEIKNPVVEFSVVEIKTKDQSESLFAEQRKGIPIRSYEKALLDLHFCRAVDLKEGLLVFFNRLHINKLEENHLKQYTKEDYQKLGIHYDEKIKQVHIVGEYASRLLQSHQKAMQFVDDYFQLDAATFIKRYFPGKEKILSRSLTDAKFKQIFGDLSPEQLNIVQANEDRILVSAGPGSGKTKTLVHKMASLLLLEEVKPEQFLMLAFSRPAAMEFRSRLNQLVPGMASHIDIHTYHAFAFQLLGKIGDLAKMDNIIGDATIAIREKTIPLEKVSGKTVIMLDEFQDVGDKEYDLLMAIKENTDEIRMIAAGDDDQSIYGFRGASVEYMLRYASENACKQFFLTKNFRAQKNLVDFSNQYLPKLGASRLKTGQILHSALPQDGKILLSLYRNGNFLTDVAKNIKQTLSPGSVAVLTRTNDEALLIKTYLEKMGLNPQLLGGNEGFRLGNLEELRRFSEWIVEGKEVGMGLIPKEKWEDAKTLLKSHFFQSENLLLAMQVIKEFENSVKEVFLSEWREYLFEIHLEDIYHLDGNSMTVSTMHKSKGKEFDQVHLILNGPQEDHRLLYVALTRARKELSIYTNTSIFSGIQAPGLTKAENSEVFAAPQEIQYTCGLRDVNLNSFKNENVFQLLARFPSGKSLTFGGGQIVGFNISEELNQSIPFSGKFKTKIQEWQSKGYRVSKMKAAWIIRWKPQDEDREWRVLLPEVHFVRES
jgi:ATP-dependent DNA helicase RecQ